MELPKKCLNKRCEVSFKGTFNLFQDSQGFLICTVCDTIQMRSEIEFYKTYKKLIPFRLKENAGFFMRV